LIDFDCLIEYFSEIMGCTGTKATKAEGDIDRYHQDIFEAAQTGDDRRLKEILDELDKRKALSTKKEVLNMGM
jgi:hypothetical protein